MSCNTKNTDTYTVNKIPNQTLKITGQGTDEHWQKANSLTDFSYPWRKETPPKTEFKALYDEEWFYFLYRAEDPEIITKSDPTINQEMEVVNSDRVEIFFKKDDQMNPYYSLELNARGRILDTKGRHYRDIDFDWNWPEGHLIVEASMDENGYWVEGKISFESLRELDMLSDGFLRAGLYRGEYQTLADGKRETKWISWIKPDSETPDFHIPSSFGVLKLE
jgi:hypothetical protein